MGLDLNREINRDERQALSRQWQEHLDTVALLVNPQDLLVARSATKPENFGWDQGEMRPNFDHSRWDLLGLLVPEPESASNQQLALVGLTKAEVHRVMMQAEFGDDTAMVEMYSRMTPAELDAEIARLESML